MKRLFQVTGLLLVIASAIYIGTLRYIGELDQSRAWLIQEAGQPFYVNLEPAVIPPTQTFAPPRGEHFELTALDFPDRSRFGVNRFRREPFEPILSVGGVEFALAQTSFPGESGRYRIWVDYFQTKGKEGTLSVLVDENPVSVINVGGTEKRWVRLELPEDISIANHATLALKADKILTEALVGHLTFQRLGDAVAIRRPVRLMRGPMLQWVTETTAHLVWETNLPCTAKVEFGKTVACEQNIVSDEKAKRHVVELRGLEAGQEYFYRVLSDDRLLTQPVRFRTNKPAGEPFRFVVLGDSGIGGKSQDSIAKGIEKSQPDFVVHVGDVVYYSGSRMEYLSGFYEPYANLLPRVPFYPCLGNHDYGSANAAPYLSTFFLPDNGPFATSRGRNYWFQYGDALFVAVDSNSAEWRLQESVGPWLTDLLTQSHAKWKFVYFHHPPFSAGHRPETDPDAVRVRRTLVPVFERTQPTIVFCGHDHLYSRMKPINGVRYVVSGAGGAPLYEKKFDYPYSEVFYNKHHSFTQVDIAKDELSLKQINSEGTVVDTFTLAK